MAAAATSSTPGVMAAVGGASIHAKDDEFPILCETCLGENPLVRMTKEQHGKACKICERPFTVYRWKPGPKARYKKTELCHTCAKLKNACQTCILDLQFGLPLQVRDQALAEHAKIAMPQSDVGRGYMIEQAEKAMAAEGAVSHHSVVDVATIRPGSMLDRLAKRTPYYKRNEAHLCSFYARGECNRGVLCPFRHEMPVGGALSKQNFKDRYYGNNDPVAAKMLKRASSSAGALVPPDDPSITTLWLGGLDAATSEEELRTRFYPFGELQSIRVVPLKQCAFVTFQSRVAAEEAAKKLHDKLQFRGSNVKMSWGKPRADRNDPANRAAAAAASSGVGGGYGAPVPAAAASGSVLPASLAAGSGGGPPGVSGPPPGVRAPPGVSFPTPPPGIGQLRLAAADPRQHASKLPTA